MADRTGATSSSTIPDLGAMTHVWLPITLNQESQTMTVAWRNQWDLSVFPAAVPEPNGIVLSFAAAMGLFAYASARRLRRSEIER